MLDSYIIEEIKRREEEHRREQPSLPPPPPPEPLKAPEKKSDRGVVIIQL